MSLTSEERYGIELRAEKVLTEWAFDYFNALSSDESKNTSGDHVCLLVNVGRCVFKWQRLSEGYDGTFVSLVNKSSDEAFSDLSDVEQRGVLGSTNMIYRVPSLDDIPPVFDEKMAIWVEELEQMREKQHA